MNFFTGIGSRKTPSSLYPLIKDLAEKLIEKDYVLRSGGAKGADSLWERAYNELGGKMEIFLPFKNFENNKSSLYVSAPAAYLIAEKIHPAWHRCSKFARDCHARNVHQILGIDLRSPSNFVVSWTEDGKASGGSATAMNLAKEQNIFVYNLNVAEEIAALNLFCLFS